MRMKPWLAAVVGVASILTVQVISGQTSKPAAPATVILDDLVVANRILANENILDGLGHISARSLQRPDHFFLSRDLAPGLVTAADLVEYDLDGNPVNAKAPQGYRERYIHAAVFKARPDVMSVVHSHMPSVLPFTDSTVPLRPMYHMAVFLVPGVPMFEIRKVQGQVGMLIDNNSFLDHTGAAAIVTVTLHLVLRHERARAARVVLVVVREQDPDCFAPLLGQLVQGLTEDRLLLGPGRARIDHPELLVAEDVGESRQDLDVLFGRRGESDHEICGLFSPGDSFRELGDRQARAQHGAPRLVRAVGQRDPVSEVRRDDPLSLAHLGHVVGRDASLGDEYRSDEIDGCRLVRSAGADDDG